MDETAPRMTRSRIRLSIENNEELNSPATPTKQRARKLLKPVLEDISENAVGSPKRTTRRSLAAESTSADPGTPGKLTRARANSSITETQTTDSPRRVTRRNSIAGSDADTSTVLTPVRRSRRISKEYYKSPETTVEIKLSTKKGRRGSTATREIIIEENNAEESDLVSSPTKNKSPGTKTPRASTKSPQVLEENSPTSVRKSTRLSSKKDASFSDQESMEIIHISKNQIRQESPVKNRSSNSHQSNDENSKNNSILKSPMNNETRKRKLSDSMLKSPGAENSDKTSNSPRSPSVQNIETRKRKSSESILKSPFLNNESLLNKPSDSLLKSPSVQNIESTKRKSSESILKSPSSGIRLNKLSDSLLASPAQNVETRNRKSSESIIKSPTNTESILNKTSDSTMKSPSPQSNENRKRKSSESTLKSPSLNTESLSNKLSDSTIKSPSSQINESLKNKSSQSMLKSPLILNNKSYGDIVSTDQRNDVNNVESLGVINQKDKKDSVHTSDIIFEDLDGMNESELSIMENKASKNDSCVSMEVDVTIPDLVSSHSKHKSGLSASNNESVKSDSEVLEKSTQAKKHANRSASKVENNDNVFINDSIKKINEKLDGIREISNNDLSETKKTPMRLKTLKSGVFTSTPVQEDLLQKSKKEKSMLMRNEKISESSSEESCSGNEDGPKRTLLRSEAIDAGKDYQSGDSQDESEREYAEENEIPIKGETLDSDEDNSDDTDYEKDSFVVSSDEEDNQLLSGSGDDLSLSDNELKMTKKSKQKFDAKKNKLQKKASKEMYEARHGKNESSQCDESDDPDIQFTSKNKSRNRMRFDSSMETTDTKINDEKEISVPRNVSVSDKDPLMTNISIKKEVLEVSTKEKSYSEEIENITVAENVTIFANKDDRNPLESFVCENETSNSDSSDDGGIADNYSALLNNLNESSRKNTSHNFDTEYRKESNIEQKQNPKLKNVSLSEDGKSKSKKKTNISLLDKLNITLSGKENKTKAESELKINNNMEKRIANINKSLEKLSEKVIEPENVSKKENRELKKGHSFMENKVEKPKNDSIIEKLNLTSSGKNKKVNFDSSKESKIESAKSNTESKCEVSSDDSSDAFDFKLLFNQDEENESEMDESIPPKRSEAKTNLLSQEHADNVDSKNSKDEKPASPEKCVSVNNENKAIEDTKVESKSKRKRMKAKLRKLNSEGGISKEDQTNAEISRKRKNVDDGSENNNKVYLTSSENKIKVTKLPQSVLQKLDDVPTAAVEKPRSKATVIATSNFNVESVTLRKNKPSQYLEDSIHIDRSPVANAHNAKNVKKPKILPSLPAAKTSADGFTSNFRVNVLKQDKRHDEVATEVEKGMVNFKTQRLYGNSIVRVTTKELCRKQTKIKHVRY